jgi:ABC-2 type transport system ATP-binding protein
MEPRAAILRTEGLSKRYGERWAVRSLDLEVLRGDVFGFLGPNGAGKTTTIRMMLGLIRATAGKVFIGGVDMHGSAIEARGMVGAMVEAPAFYGYLTGRQNLMLLGRISGGVGEAGVDEALGLVGLTARADDKVKGYSQGMRQRLGIAQALMSGPELVILDEPTNGLDPSGMREMRALITRLAGERGMTVFISSHLLYEVEMVCNKVAVINNGSLVAQGPVTELLDRESFRLEIKVDDAARAAEVAASLKYVSGIVMDGKTSLSMSVQMEMVPEVNRALVHAGLKVSALLPHTASLEEFFLEITGGAGDGPPPGRRDDGRRDA